MQRCHRPATAPVATKTEPNASPDTAPSEAAGLEASLMGYGKARFGMTVGQVKQALDNTFAGQNDHGAACHHLAPTGKGQLEWFTLMFEGGKFVRFDVGNDKLVAPGGGKRGMTSAQLDALYRDAFHDTPHRFVKGGEYRSIAAGDPVASTLVFETDAAGKVTEWHVGVSPQVDYVAGCEKHG